MRLLAVELTGVKETDTGAPLGALSKIGIINLFYQTRVVPVAIVFIINVESDPPSTLPALTVMV